MTRTITVLLGILLLTAISQTQETKAKSYQPPSGMVPNAATATAIAYAEALPVYGKKQIESELPLHAALKGQIWSVHGTLPKGWMGGTLTIQIDKASGKILYLMHGK
jgi:hypothetical protein